MMAKILKVIGEPFIRQIAIYSGNKGVAIDYRGEVMSPCDISDYDTQETSQTMSDDDVEYYVAYYGWKGYFNG